MEHPCTKELTQITEENSQHTTIKLDEETLDEDEFEDEKKQILLALLVECTKSKEILYNGTKIKQSRGVPQGGLISPLLFIFYFEKITRRTEDYLHKHGCFLQKYADDVAMFGHDFTVLRKAMIMLRTDLQSVGLEMSMQKT
jgi:retron-type reverse transcriptase